MTCRTAHWRSRSNSLSFLISDEVKNTGLQILWKYFLAKNLHFLRPFTCHFRPTVTSVQVHFFARNQMIIWQEFWAVSTEIREEQNHTDVVGQFDDCVGGLLPCTRENCRVLGLTEIQTTRIMGFEDASWVVETDDVSSINAKGVTL